VVFPDESYAKGKKKFPEKGQLRHVPTCRVGSLWGSREKQAITSVNREKSGIYIVDFWFRDERFGFSWCADIPSQPATLRH
jgi:hypothetical protein